jgi:Ca2+-binding RTX toxin-like protein
MADKISTMPCFARTRGFIGLVVALAALLLVPAAARAAPSTAAIASDGILDVTAGGDSTPHEINISFAGSYLVTDTAGVTPGAGCASLGTTAVSCTDSRAVAVGGGAGSDRITIASLGPGAASGAFRTATGLFGEGGNDTIVGSDLRDLIRAGDGNDTIDGRLGGDDLSGQRGNDTLTYANRPASQPVYVNMQQDIDGISPPAGSFGGAEGDGTDVENVIGTPGNDTIIGFNAGVFVYDSSAANTFTGGAGNDLLSGLEGADRLLGEAGNDKLLGGRQKDTLVGGANKDRCVGGPSKDKAKKCEVKRQLP